MFLDHKFVPLGRKVKMASKLIFIGHINKMATPECHISKNALKH